MDPDSIRAALDNGNLFLEYLPTVSLVTGQCVGAEALIRMRLNGIIVPPLEFMPAIETTSLGGTVTYWAIETIGTELGMWLRRAEDVHIGINIPPQLLGRGGIEYSIRKAGLSELTEKLMLEIIERGLIDELGVSALSLATKYKMQIALDDVTLREINLVSMSRALIDCIKLDKSLVEAVTSGCTDSDTNKIVSLLASFPGLRIIAEGVETQKQAELLAALGIELAQGYYFSEPLRVDEFISYWERTN